MGDVATQHGARRKLRPQEDESSHGRRRAPRRKPILEHIPWRTTPHGEAAERLLGARGLTLEDALADGRYMRRTNSAAQLLAVLQRWAHKTGNGQGYTSRQQLAKALWADVATYEDTKRKARQMRIWGADLEAAGLARITALNGTCLRWELLDRPAGVAQSVRAPVL